MQKKYDYVHMSKAVFVTILRILGWLLTILKQTSWKGFKEGFSELTSDFHRSNQKLYIYCSILHEKKNPAIIVKTISAIYV
jgi:hypothetical protein